MSKQSKGAGAFVFTIKYDWRTVQCNLTHMLTCLKKTTSSQTHRELSKITRVNRKIKRKRSLVHDYKTNSNFKI